MVVLGLQAKDMLVEMVIMVVIKDMVVVVVVDILVPVQRHHLLATILLMAGMVERDLLVVFLVLAMSMDPEVVAEQLVQIMMPVPVEMVELEQVMDLIVTITPHKTLPIMDVVAVAECVTTELKPVDLGTKV
jgi:hypothetical protein